MMKNISVNTGLNAFMLIDRIIQVGEQGISGIKTFSNAPAYLGLESLAQLGAFHVRYVTEFQRHAFLLKIERCAVHEQVGLDGTYKLSGNLLSRSASAFSYILQAEEGGGVRIEGRFLFATVAYDQTFKKKTLQEHYQKVFSCLQSDLKEK
jgi:hypothetical protein